MPSPVTNLKQITAPGWEDIMVHMHETTIMISPIMLENLRPCHATADQSPCAPSAALVITFTSANHPLNIHPKAPPRNITPVTNPVRGIEGDSGSLVLACGGSRTVQRVIKTSIALKQNHNVSRHVCREA